MKYTLKTIVAVTTLGTASIASAVTYDAETNGTAFNGGSLSADGGSLQVTSISPFGSYLGVVGGGAGPEIGLDEKITISFDKPMIFDYLTLGLLFDGPEYGDPFEIAGALATNWENDTELFTLTVTSATNATWDGFAGTVTNISPADLGTAGIWRIDNPFGRAAVTSVSLQPLTSSLGSGVGDQDSDFGLVAFGVPDNGATLALLGLALSSLAFFRRKL